MDDLQHLEMDYWKPFRTVLKYFRFTAIDIFDEYELLTFLKIKYFYIFLHTITMGGVICFLKERVYSCVDLLDVSIDLSYAISSLEGCLLYLQFLYSKKKIKTFVLKLGQKWRDYGSLSPDLVASQLKKIKSLDRFNYVYFTGTAVFVHLYMLMPLAVLVTKKVVFKEDVIYFLPFRLSVPFKYDDNFFLYLLVYGFIYVLIPIGPFRFYLYILSIVILKQLTYILAINLTYLINGSLLLLTVSMNQLRVLFDLLQDEFRDIFKSKDDFNMDDKIKQTIRRHSELLKLTDELSSAFGATFILHLFFLSAVICFYSVSAMIYGRLEDFKNLMGSIISITTIYHCCYHGQLLADSAFDVGNATYDSEWYSLSCEYKKIVLIIILRSQQITYVQSTSYTHVSLTTFIKIMHMAWSFISLITGMYKEK